MHPRPQALMARGRFPQGDLGSSMGLQDKVESLAKQLALLDPQDAESVYGFVEEVQTFARQTGPFRVEGLDVIHQEAARILKAIPNAEQAEANSLLDDINRIVDYYMLVAERIDEQLPLEGLHPPIDIEGCDQASATSSSGGAIDHELLELFVQSCDAGLAELEAEILSFEKSEDREELLSSIRRSVHTFKGECGVLSLAVAQDLCHRAESGMDLVTEEGRAFPTDLLLTLVDWLRSYVEVLKEDPSSPAPDSESLFEGLEGFLQGEDAAPAIASTEGTQDVSSPDDKAADTKQAAAQDPAPIAEASEPGGGALWAMPDPTANPSPTETAATPPRVEPEATDKAPNDAAEAKPEPVLQGPVEFEIDEEFLDTLPDYLSEAQTHLASAEVAMLEFDQSGREDFEQIDKTFRSFHTIKGVAGFLNLEAIVRLAHTAEALLDGLRKRSFECSTEMIDLILKSNDALGRLNEVLQGEASMDHSELASLILQLEQVTEAGGSPTSSPEKDADPAPAREDAQSQPPAIASSQGTTEETSKQRPAKPASPQAAKPAVPAKQKKSRLGKKLDSTITVNTRRLDNLVDLVGELVIAQSMIIQDPGLRSLSSQKLNRNLSQVNKITRDLQEGAMSLRMVTVKSTFQKMARLVRDVSAKAKKKVDFQISGEETELDRNVVEEISDPLVHMIRNAIDHGIESPEDRLAAGKDPTGTLNLKAYHQGGSIVIEVTDDGKGLDKNKLIAKAIEKEVLPANTTPDDLSDTDSYNLIFKAGFSTAEKVTDISGRGVGMDVVRRNIEQLRGKVEIDSKLGQGTRFKMMLPLTLAIIDGMVVRVAGQRYVIPTLAIVQSFKPSDDVLSGVLGRAETVSVRGDLLPLHKLRDLFALENGVRDPKEGLVIVVEDNATRSCLLVDEILGQQQVVIKTLGKGTGKIRGVSGGAILGDGRVALIIDVGSLLAEAVSLTPAI